MEQPVDNPPHNLPALPLPDPLRGDDPGSFTQLTVSVRLPRLAGLVIEENNLTPGSVANLKTLQEEIKNGEIRPLQDRSAPDILDWDRYCAPYVGRTWFQVPWFFAEAYLFRRILEATGYFLPGPGNHFDPYLYEKRQGLETNRQAIRTRIIELEDKRGVWKRETIIRLLNAELWGNQIDLSMWPVGELERPNHADAEKARSHLLVDDAVEVANWFAELGGKPARIGMITDNTGPELVADLCMVDYLLGNLPKLTVVLHLRAHPTYISDAMQKDIFSTLVFFREEFPVEGNRLADRLEEAIKQGRLGLADNFFWNSPLPAWDMPNSLKDELYGLSLVISKGDANYRRFLGDLHWPFSTPFDQVVSYFHAPLLALRTCKSEVATGLQPALVDATAQKDSHWITDGLWGMIQFKP